jgi:glycosyltransferase involved in cell wall biosynthesis
MYCVKHPNKVVWLLHQHRQAYELWGTEFGDLEHMEYGYQVRDIIINADNKYLPESKNIYTISDTVTQRLYKYNNIKAKTLYHPPANYENLFCDEAENYIFYPSRLHEIKRQHLIVEAMRYSKTDVKLLLAGSGEKQYTDHLRALIEKYGLSDRVKLLGKISEEDKIELYAKAFMVYNGPYQEDYGYVTLEAYFSGKPVLTHTDSGGPLEFVENDINGYAVAPDPIALAEKIDFLYEHKNLARQMGGNGLQLMKDLQINWDYVVERLVK